MCSDGEMAQKEHIIIIIIITYLHVCVVGGEHSWNEVASTTRAHTVGHLHGFRGLTAVRVVHQDLFADVESAPRFER